MIRSALSLRVPVRLSRDTRGAALIEFAIVAPVLCMFLMGAFDVAHTLYVDAALQGVVQKTARDSSLEDATATQQQAALDQRVSDGVHAIVKNADVKITRRYYRTFTQAAAAKPEDFLDTNGDGICDQGEPYVDANNNSVWDADGGNNGQGGAKDAVVYTVNVAYKRAFPIYGFIGGSDVTRLSANTVLRNQPYADQQSYSAVPPIRSCK